MDVKAEDLAAIMAKFAGTASGLPIASLYDTIYKIVVATGVAGGKKPSVWDQMEGKIKREIRNELTKYHQTDVSHKLLFYKEKLTELERRGRAISDEDRMNFVDHVYLHYQSTKEDEHLFDFDVYKRSLKFDWAMFDLYFSAITHQQLVLLVLLKE